MHTGGWHSHACYCYDSLPSDDEALAWMTVTNGLLGTENESVKLDGSLKLDALEESWE